MTENQIQSQFVDWFKLQYPNKIIAAIPNGAQLGGKNKFAQMNMLKRTGLCLGIPDLIIPEPTEKYHGLWIETKTPKGVCNPNQKIMIPKLMALGHLVVICRSLGEFQEVVRHYFKPKGRGATWSMK